MRYWPRENVFRRIRLTILTAIGIRSKERAIFDTIPSTKAKDETQGGVEHLHREKNENKKERKKNVHKIEVITDADFDQTNTNKNGITSPHFLDYFLHGHRCDVDKHCGYGQWVPPFCAQVCLKALNIILYIII